MTCMLHRLPPDFVARTREEAKRVLDDPEANERIKKLAWRFLLDERKVGLSPEAEIKNGV